jgi:GTP-binding protein LepA
VEAQTVANLYLAREHNLSIIPIINKIDLPNADIPRVYAQIRDILKFDEKEVILASAKKGEGIENILERIIQSIPPPKGDTREPLQALIFDSAFDTYKGVVVYVRVMNGHIKPGLNIRLMGTGNVYEVMEVGVFKPRPVKTDSLGCGEVGYITCNIKEAREVNAGDTITTVSHPALKPLPGYKRVRPLVFCGIYPINSKDFPLLRESLDKLRLSDGSFVYEPETSASLGFGFRCGFLGLLHMDIIQERLEREYGLDIIATTPSVVYKVKKKNGELTDVDNPTELPPPYEVDQIQEPFVRGILIVPSDAVGSVMKLAQERRGVYKSTEYLSPERGMLIYELPLAEVIVDFYDKIKSVTRGYGSWDYEFIGYLPTQLVKLDILINGEPCDALSSLVFRQKAQVKGRQLAGKLKELIPRQLFEVVIQAAIGAQVIARETIRPVGKNVTGKCYGGDITRKRKLWEKQKAGKKRMKQFGKVQIPQEAFLAVLKI